MSTVLYVLSNPSIKGLYKVGIHTGSLKQLIKRYATYIPNVEVHLFIKNIDARVIENRFKKHYKEYRVPIEHTGRMSEWFTLKMFTIVTYIITRLVGRKYGLNNKNKNFIIGKLGISTENGTEIITAKERHNVDKL